LLEAIIQTLKAKQTQNSPKTLYVTTGQGACVMYCIPLKYKHVHNLKVIVLLLQSNANTNRSTSFRMLEVHVNPKY